MGKTVMKNNKWKVWSIVLLLTFISVLFSTIFADTVYAASVKMITGSTQIVCGRSAQVKVPGGYKNCKYASSNKKVAEVTAKGKIKALRLGVSKITIKSGKSKIEYTITVVPESKKDVYLKQSVFVTGKSGKLQLASEKYDTSQVQLKRYVFDDDDFNANCYSRQVKFEGTQKFPVYYGSWEKTVQIACFPAKTMIEYLIYTSNWKDEMIEAGEKISYKGVMMGVSPSDCNTSGVKLYVDDQLIKNQMTYTPGNHVFMVKNGNYEYKQVVNLHYSISKILQTHNTAGVDADGKEVLDEAFRVLDQIIMPEMTEQQKVKAIHDYLIYSANYVNNGDYSNVEKWAYGAGGVLIHKEGVCQSYAIAFYIMTTAAGLDCHYVTGTANGGGHAWNQVKVDGKWYYIDCTWDDPIMNGHSGGGEGYEYYLSETLWSDHIAKKVTDLAEEKYSLWEDYYLTGKRYN